MSMRLIIVRVMAAGTFLISCISLLASPRFLTLPFSNPNVFLRQGWVYDSDGPYNCPDSPEGRCHKGIDYFCVEGGLVKSFDVIAAAPGRALASYTSNGYGYFVLIDHFQSDEFGRRIFTLYAHLEDSSWTVPYKDKLEMVNDITAGRTNSWMQVERGQKIARAGKSGGQAQIHLHFEVQLTGYSVIKADPYSVYGINTDYPCASSSLIPLSIRSQLPSALFTQCPPVPPPSSSIVTIASTDVPKQIPNPGQVVSSLTFPTAGSITGMKLVFRFTTECERDHIMTLTSPDGHIVTVMDRGAERCSGVPQTFISTNTDIGTAQFFGGRQAAGTWVLTARDTEPGTNSGTLDAWSLAIDVGP